MDGECLKSEHALRREQARGFDAQDLESQSSAIKLQLRNQFEEREEAEVDVSEEEIRRQRNDLIKKNIERLSREPEHFKNIFQTQRGSQYFVIPSGECLRFSKSKKGDFDVEPVTKRTYFISTEEMQRIKKLRDNARFLTDEEKEKFTYSFKKRELGEGLFPLEFGIAGMIEPIPGPQDGLSEDVVLQGTLYVQTDYKESILTTPIHFGNVITKILK